MGKSQLDEEVTKASAALNDAIDVVSNKTQVVQDAEKSRKEAAVSLKDAKAAQAAGDAQIMKIESERQELKETLEKYLCGESFEADAAIRHRDAVMHVLRRSTHAFENTLLMTLPEALIKPPAERGDFDKMAIDTLQKNLGEYVEKLDGELRASEESKTAQAAAVEAAAAGSTFAQDQEIVALNELASAKEKQKAAAAGLDAAKAAVQSFEPSLQSAVAGRDSKQADFTKFVEHNIKSFAILESKASDVTAEEISKLGA